MEMTDSSLQESIKRLSGLSDGSVDNEFESLTAKGIRVVEARRGFFICDFIVHSGVSDENGNWLVGAMATLIDVVGSLVLHSVTSSPMLSVEFCISYFSTAKVQNEIEIEARVAGEQGRLTSVVVEVRKKGSADLVALGKQWMIPARSNANHQTSKL